jgi:Na+-transporting NADH:ubiquinone oxidoreductase subunit F
VNWEFISGPIVVSVMSAILALIISLVDRIVNNYGEVTIDINQAQKSFTLRGGSSLLESLWSQGIYLPSACGGKGTCGTCKAKVLTDIGTYLPTEIPLLSEGEKKEGVHLACQVKVKKNLAIEIPEQLFNISLFRTAVESIVDVTHDIKEVYVKLIEPQHISFKAGQYAQFIIPPHGKIRRSTQRAYSMLSTPSDSDRLGFLIRLVPGGIATTFVHTQLKKGEELELIAPVGEFMLHENDAVMICIAGGSGMAPIHSILFDMEQRGLTDRDVWYFFGARNLNELFYTDNFLELGKRWSRFHFVPALSEPLPGDNWKGEIGLITDVVDKYLNDRIGPSGRKHAYLCGGPGMIDACIKVLTSHSIDEGGIYYDKFA